MKWNAFLRVGTGIALGGVLAACGGGGHDGGKVDPEPQPVRALSGLIGAAAPLAGRPTAPASGPDLRA